MKIQSSAFPAQKMPQIFSDSHQLLQKHLKNHPLPAVSIRDYRLSDQEELRKLQKEWFPLNYSDDFYDKVNNGIATCFIAETTVSVVLGDQEKEVEMTIIVGAVIFELTVECEELEASLFNRVFLSQQNALYIMTLGVVDELRSTGLAKRLLQKLIIYAQTLPRIGLLLLHVVLYNTRAIKFYKRNGFSMLQYLPQHYHIMGQQYDGLKLGIFINEGRRRQKWGKWLKRVIFRMAIQDEWPV